VAREATDIYRPFASERPDEFLPGLAKSLDNLGNRLSGLGRREDALAAALAATEIYRRLAVEQPDAFQPVLLGSLDNLGIRLGELGRREDALAAAHEAADVYRRLAAERPDAFLPDLALTLSLMGLHLSELGRREEAFAAAREAVTLLAPFFLRLPAAHAEWMRAMCGEYVDLSERLGVEPDATLLAPIAEAFQKLQAPLDADPPDGA